MPTDRDDDSLGSQSEERRVGDADAEALGVHKRPHGDVEHWLEHNLKEGQGPVVQTDRHDAGDQRSAAPGSSAPTEDNLVQLPAGADFGSEHEPSPQEREELARFAAAANAELHDQEAVDQRLPEQGRRRVTPGQDAET